MKTKQQQNPTTNQQSIPQNLLPPLSQLITYNRNNFLSLTLSQLKPTLQIQIRKIQNKTNPQGYNLLLIVLNNHIKAIYDITQIHGINNIVNNTSRSFNQKNNIIVYEELGNQFIQSDQQLNKLIVLNHDLNKAQGAIQLAIKYYTNKNYRFKNYKIIQSRVRLLEIIFTLLKVSANGYQNGNKQLPSLPKLGHKNTSFHQLEVSHVRLIVQQLDQKVYQLSTISQQIPQLQTFKRTLDLTMPQHNAYLTKIVDVLIQLHHKVNKLISRRPQKLLKQIQSVQQQCYIIQKSILQFLQKLQSIDQLQITLKPIYFDQRTNKSPDHFRKIQKSIVKFSQIIIQCMNLQQQSRQRILQIKSLIQVFWNLIAGMEQYQQQWKIYKNRQQKSDDQQQIIQMLELCLKFVNDRIDKMNEEFQIQRQNLIDGNIKNIQFLEQDISRMSKQIQDQQLVINQMERQNQLLRGDLDTFQDKFKELLRKHQADSQDYLMKLNILQKRQKNYKDKIQSLQSQNEQKKVMITNITNDLKRVMKQSQNSKKADQKNKDLQDSQDKLFKKIQELQRQIRNLKQDNALLNLQKQQNQRNSDLLIKRLDQANCKINDLQNQLSDSKYKNNREIAYLKQQIQQQQKQIKKFGQQTTASIQVKVKEYERKQNEQKQTIAKKDQKISQLNVKIVDLNSKLNEILNNYKNMQFQLKRKQQTVQDMSTSIVNLQTKNTTQHTDLIRVYQANQRQLTNALAEIDRCRNKIVPDLQAQIRRRQQIIAEMQRIINQLQDKQTIILGQEENNNKIRRMLDDLQNKLRAKQQQLYNNTRNYQAALRDKDTKIRELDYNISSHLSKVNQLQSQLKLNTEDKAKRLQDQDKIRVLQNQNARIKTDYDRKLKEQQNALKEAQAKLQKSRDLQNELKNTSQRLNILNDIQLQLKRTKEQLSKLKQFESLNANQNSKIALLESTINNKNRQLGDLQQKIRNLQNILRNQQKAIQNAKYLQNTITNQQKDLQKTRQLENSIRNHTQKIKELQNTNRQQLRQIQKYKYLQNMMRNQQQQLQKVGTLTNTLRDQQQKTRKLQNTIREQQRQLQKIRTLQNTIRDQQRELQRNKNLERKFYDLQQQLQKAKAFQNTVKVQQKQLQRTRNLERKIRDMQTQLQKAKLLQNIIRDQQKELQKTKILQNTILDQQRELQRTRSQDSTVLDMQRQRQMVRSLQNTLRDQQKQLQHTRVLIDQLRKNQTQITKLREQIAIFQKNAQFTIRTDQYTKQIEYLRQKVRSLQDLIDILSQQRNISQQNLKQSKQNQKSTTQNTTNYTNLQQQHSKLQNQYIQLQKILKQKQQKISQLTIKLQEIKQKYESVNININKKLFDEQNNNGERQKQWVRKQKQYIEKIQSFRKQLAYMQSKINTINTNANGNKNISIGDKYYLRTQGQRLQDIIKSIQNGTIHVTTKLQQILSNSRIRQISQQSNNPTNIPQLHILAQQNKLLIQHLNKLLQQKQQLSALVHNYPNFEFVIEYAYRIITYFTQIHPQSIQGKAIWQQLQSIHQSNHGQKFFIILQQFTKFTLQECTIQIYRRQLKQKSIQLQLLKSRLNSIIEQALTHQRILYEKTALTQSRIKLFKARYENKYVGKYG